jgi:hypothetical protein
MTRLAGLEIGRTKDAALAMKIGQRLVDFGGLDGRGDGGRQHTRRRIV